MWLLVWIFFSGVIVIGTAVFLGEWSADRKKKRLDSICEGVLYSLHTRNRDTAMSHMNPWITAHERWYQRATPAERAAFDASRECPRSKVFTAAQFPTPAAWVAFLTLQSATEEVLAGTMLPTRHKVDGQVRVYDALQDRDKALAGVARCLRMFCGTTGTDVKRYQMTYNDGTKTEAHLCPRCARGQTLDPMNEVAAIVEA